MGSPTLELMDTIDMKAPWKCSRVISSYILTFFFILLSATGDAFACRCTSPITSQSYKNADAVVLAKAVSVVEDRENQTQIATLTILEAWKKAIPSQLKVNAGGKVCGFFFKEGQEYIVYLISGKDGQYSTKNCIGNKYLNNPELPLSFGKSARDDIAWLRRYGRK